MPRGRRERVTKPWATIVNTNWNKQWTARKDPRDNLVRDVSEHYKHKRHRAHKQSTTTTNKTICMHAWSRRQVFSYCEMIKLINLMVVSFIVRQMSGVGPSMRFVTKYAGNVFKLATKAAPDELIAGLAAHQIMDSSGDEFLVNRLHYYTFGGLNSTLQWANSTAEGHFTLAADGKSFDVSS